MTNAEKLIELIKENFPEVNGFTSVAYLETDCDFIQCPDDKDISCVNCPYKNFWKSEYKDLTNE